MGEQQGARLDRAEPVDQGVEARGRPGVDHEAVDLEGADHPVSAHVQEVYGTRQSDSTIQSFE